MHDFGYVALNMKYVNPEDSGTYTCRATNELGQAVTSASLFVQCKFSITAIISAVLKIILFINFSQIIFANGNSTRRCSSKNTPTGR